LLTLDVSRTEVNEKEPLSITDNGSGKSGRLAIIGNTNLRQCSGG
jgi:hypothetical protein